jgi:hypothetical protein
MTHLELFSILLLLNSTILYFLELVIMARLPSLKRSRLLLDRHRTVQRSESLDKFRQSRLQDQILGLAKNFSVAKIRVF